MRFRNLSSFDCFGRSTEAFERLAGVIANRLYSEISVVISLDLTMRPPRMSPVSLTSSSKPFCPSEKQRQARLDRRVRTNRLDILIQMAGWVSERLVRSGFVRARVGVDDESSLRLKNCGWCFVAPHAKRPKTLFKTNYPRTLYLLLRRCHYYLTKKRGFKKCVLPY